MTTIIKVPAKTEREKRSTPPRFNFQIALFPEWALPSTLHIHERDIRARIVSGVNMKAPLLSSGENDHE